jgi:hypothetical protein
VVVSAVREKCAVVTSDPDDVRALADAHDSALDLHVV